jgi:hypothetical protein
MIETPLYGNNLCNLLSNNVIQEFNKIDKNHISEIYVSNFNQFIVLKGISTISNPLNYSKLFSEYIFNINQSEHNFNVIDLIEYNKISKKDFIDIIVTSSKNNENKVFFTESKLQGSYNIDFKNQIITHNNKDLLLEISKIFNIDNYKVNFQNIFNSFNSEKFYGKSLDYEKVYTVYLKYISNHIIQKHICSEINLRLIFNSTVDEISWENLTLEVDSKKSIVSNEWIESLILDIFDFNFNYVKKHLSLNNYNFENELLFSDKCWNKLDKLSEIILI